MFSLILTPALKPSEFLTFEKTHNFLGLMPAQRAKKSNDVFCLNFEIV